MTSHCDSVFVYFQSNYMYSDITVSLLVVVAAVAMLGVDTDIIRDIATKDKITQAMLNSVVNWVLKGLEEPW